MQITGRLGNNLFQIAVAYALAKRYNTDFFMVYNQYNKYEQEWNEYFSEITFIPRHTLTDIIKHFLKSVEVLIVLSIIHSLKNISMVTFI